MTTHEEFDERARQRALDTVRPLDGCLIIGIDAEQTWEGDYFPVFIVTNQQQETFRVVVSQDEEGNGPGVLFIEDPDTTPADNG